MPPGPPRSSKRPGCVLAQPGRFDVDDGEKAVRLPCLTQAKGSGRRMPGGPFRLYQGVWGE